MRLLKLMLIFYQKLLLPSLLFSLLLGILSSGISGGFSFATVGFSYLFAALFFHYIIYEVRFPNEYYFYYNMGLSKLGLWIISFAFSSIIALIISVL